MQSLNAVLLFCRMVKVRYDLQHLVVLSIKSENVFPGFLVILSI